MSMLLLLATALALGMRHALDPDHLAAVSTIATEERRLWPAARLGLIWGAGHLLPIALLGLPILLLRLDLPETLEHLVDLGVGLLLVALGGRTLWRLYRERQHRQAHEHGHEHTHAQSGRERRGALTFTIGMVHGLAGTGAAAVLALTAAPTLAAGAGYLLAFGVGTFLGMFAATLCIVAPALSLLSRFASLRTSTRFLAGGGSIAIGILMWLQLMPALLA